MLTLITGQIGNGKTLHAIELIEQLRKESGRDVYYWNIPGLKLPWKPMGDPSTFGQKDKEPDASVAREWYKLPDGAIIVMDECQKLFRVRKQGEAVPRMVSEIETHRHKGFDLFFLSQNLKQIDTGVRYLVGRHLNVVRRFGFERAMVSQWERIADPTSTKDEKEALKTEWKYPKELYGVYKSSAQHTVKKDFPMRKLAALGGGVALLVVCIAVTMRHISSLKGTPVSAAVGSLGESGEVPRVNNWDVVGRSPRVYAVPESAPMYDAVYKVVSAPTVAGCSSYVYEGGVIDCTCTTMQGTVIDMPVLQCQNIMKKGRFDPSKRVRDLKAENIAYLNSRDSAGRNTDFAAQPGQQAGVSAAN